MTDFLTSLHTKLEPDSLATATGAKNRHLLNTRRLLRWARQIAAGMDFIAARDVVHGDLALR